jgi:Raf kinase inhibitor-like YbhB/YbcL family protein
MRANRKGNMKVHGSLWMAVATLAVASLQLSDANAAALNDQEAGKGKPAAGYSLTSDDFKPDSTLPESVTCDGAGKSPSLRWTVGKNEKPKSFVLIVDDPDAVKATYTHWVLFDIPAATRNIPAGATDVGVSGNNSADKTGWTPPCPPAGRGTHRFVFRLKALDVEKLGTALGASRADVETAMENHVLGDAELTSKYQRE